MDQNPEYKHSREYSLSRVQQLALEESVHFNSAKVFRDTSNLRYSHEQVCKCLSQLAAENFHHSVRYPPQTIWLDVYKIKYISPGADIDDLYIKLYVTNDCLTVVLCSFHLEGQL